MTIAEQFHQWAHEALDEWDGVSTADLFLAVLQRTGEDAKRVLAEVASRLPRKWYRCTGCGLKGDEMCFMPASPKYPYIRCVICRRHAEEVSHVR